MRPATSLSNAFAAEIKQDQSKYASAVIRQARDRAGQVLGYLTARHDGTTAGIIAAAQAVTERMFLAFDDVSNINSPIIVTDAAGAARWIISPNFRFITEIDAPKPYAVSRPRRLTFTWRR